LAGNLQIIITDNKHADGRTHEVIIASVNNIQVRSGSLKL